jgi:two-component system, NarL family, sensor histidine kinase YdfH
MNAVTRLTDRLKLRDETWLFVILLLVLESVYGWALFTVPGLGTMPRLLPFTGLMLAHLALHLAAARLRPRPAWLPLYFLLQAVLAGAICAMTRAAGAPVALYLFAALAGQSVALVGGAWRAAAWPVVGFFGLGFGLYGWWWGWAGLPAFFVMAAPQAYFFVAFVFLFVRQANARRQAQALLQELEQAHTELAAYADQVEALTLAAERQRVARELHDTLAQGLAGLILRLEAIDAQLAREQTARARTLVEQALKRARAALAEARQAIDALRAAEQAPLPERLRDEVAHFRELSGLPCALLLDAMPPLPADLDDLLLRAVREGLANVARHAQAPQVQVRLSHDDGEVKLLVADDGQGFDPLSMTHQNGHYGLAGLRERARLAGGALNITSRAGQGTVLRVRLPPPTEQHETAHV